MINMFVELEDKIVEVLRGKIKEVPRENITIDREPNNPPAITISNITFKVGRASLAEDEEGEEINEVFNGNGVKKAFKLREKPTTIIAVESPKGRGIREIDDYTVDYDEGVVVFRKAPSKGRGNIVVKYVSARRRMMVVRFKLKAKYNISIVAQDRVQVDRIAESVVKTLTELEDELEKIGGSLKPVKGKRIENKINLVYLAEIEFKLEKPIPPIERIEVSERRGFKDESTG